MNETTNGTRWHVVGLLPLLLDMRRNFLIRWPVAAALALAALLGFSHSATAGGVVEAPLLWCAVQGSPTAVNPQAVGALDGYPTASLSDDLWHRHERPTDKIFNVANVSFRSALDQLSISDVFPIIADPDPTRDMPGDINLSRDAQSNKEMQDVIRDCQDHWIVILGRHDKCQGGVCALTKGSCGSDADCPGFNRGSLPGIPVINANHITGCNCTGWGTAGMVGGRAADDHNAYSPVVGHVFVQDRMYATSGDEDAQLVGHELGHVLGLWHTNLFPGEVPGCSAIPGPPNNVMTAGSGSSGLGLSSSIMDMVDFIDPTTCMPDPSPFTGTVPRTIDQIAWSPIEAEEWPGSPHDPPGVLLPGAVQSFLRVDEHRDVPSGEPFVDLSALRVTEGLPTGFTRFTHRVLGVVDSASSSPGLDYWVLVDRDDDAGTGGGPSAFPSGVPEAAFTGVELITRVHVVPSGPTLIPTVWLFDPGTGSFVPSGDEFITAFLERTPDHPGPPDVETLFEHVTLSFQNTTRGPVGDVFRLQACAQNEETGTVDCLDDSGLGLGARYSLVPPQFPSCGVTPALVDPGGVATVQVEGLHPDAPIHVLLGDRLVADAMTDGSGEASVPFRIGVDSRSGLRLVTVGVNGTALTADCFADVSAALPFFLTPEIARNAPGTDHTVTATLRDEAGAAVPGIPVSFRVDSGPNAGASGVCSFNSDCTTDSSGMVSFTYTGNGDPGVDAITASFLNTTTESSNTALKFWDVDCNQNDVADTCDIDCAGFESACAEVLGCGGSLDENADGVPDECNRPPDCSNAGAEPDELWPPYHREKEVAIAGVTDEDGDPIAITVDSIFQDEPVSGRGSGRTSPDADGIGGGVARLRSERAGSGDGRVYHVIFTAEDGRGGTCGGEATVCVPHDQRPGHFCVDQGSLYDSTAHDGARRHL